MEVKLGQLLRKHGTRLLTALEGWIEFYRLVGKTGFVIRRYYKGCG